MRIPDGVLTTRCIPGCPSRISWEYDEGEPRTWDYPGTDDEVWPATGCSDAHLLLLCTPAYASLESHIWYLLEEYLRLLDESEDRKWSSLRHLVGIRGLVCLGVFPSLTGPRRIVIQVPDPADFDDLPW